MSRNTGRRVKIKPKKQEKLAMTTKEQLAARPRPESYFRQDVSIKVRRSIASRRNAVSTGVLPVSFSRPVGLSPLYKKEVKEKYINQVFTSVVKIGQGCFGDVYRAQSKEDLKFYAIKITNDTHSFMDKGEVQRLEKIPPHEHCVQFFVAWQENYRLYIQMELCKTSLDKYLSVYHGLDERRAWEIFVDISLGIQHLHMNELIHFDIKPANIMISTNGVCKIGDFGLVIDLQEVETSNKKVPVFSTVSEGDGRYVALEVLQEKIYSKAADIFSLGLLMLETVSDIVLPTSGSDWLQLREGDVSILACGLSLSAAFRQLIVQMLLKNYEVRPTITDVLHSPPAIKILNDRHLGQRFNIMETWDEDSVTHNTNIPTVDGGPSPPRRPYPINYLTPLDTINRTPFKELHWGNKPRGVARRLF